MFALTDKQVVVVGLGASGQAACRLLAARGARVTALDSADTSALRQTATELTALGVRTGLGVVVPPSERYDLVVVSPGVSLELPLMKAVSKQKELSSIRIKKRHG